MFKAFWDGFLSASGTEMHGYLVYAEKICLSDYPIDKFYYYLIVDVNNDVALLGNDFLSYCEFKHEEKGDILITGVNLAFFFFGHYNNREVITSYN